MSEAPIQPIYDRILLKEAEEDQRTDSGIYLAPGSDHGPKKGEVIATGDGILIPQTGDLVDLKVEVGDVVVYNDRDAQPLTVDGEEYILLRQDNVLGIYRG